MAKRRFGIIVLLACICLCMLPCSPLAASTADAKEPISVDTACSLTLCYGYEGIPFPDQSVRLYHVAEVSADFRYTLTPPFAASGLSLNGVQTNSEWNVIRSTLEALVLAGNITPTKTAQTDENGQARFTQLTPGLYLTSPVDVVRDDLTCCFDSLLVALPDLDPEGLWQYQVTATAKPEALPPIHPEEEIQLKVVKLWKGDQERTDRPERIEVEIFRDGVSYETVILSESNSWSYGWTAKDDGADWKVVERNVPDGYTMTVAQRETTFVITNTRQDTPDPPPPQTGDTSNILLYSILLFVSGSMLIILGILGKRLRHEDKN